MEGNCWSIKVYARIKPFDNSKGSELTEYDIYDRVSVDSNTDCLKSKIVFNHKPSGETVNNKVEQQTFRFCKVFDQDTQQEEIYEVVAKPVVDSVLEGYNGTVFAYGQTGSGKTFSITGGPDKYEDRGIIPRSIQQIFNSICLMPDDVKTTVLISYCEIYNETGYDLLDAAPKARKKLEDLPRVSISEDLHGNFHFRNLALKKVETEEEALNLLFLGDSNRVTAETPMNKSSSRSHCVFTIVLASRSESSGMSRRSKLNLVDLAGSERVSKTGINGKILEEAKNINLSLHFLEQVIVALNTPDCKHIPYRNSMMTIILKDSLGGNCLTTMLATLSAELENIWETISTCRFAQRVALIKNEVFVNEELDPLMEVKILKEDIKALKRQLALVGAESVDVELTPDEIGECQTLVQEILSKENIEHLPQIPPDLRKINQCTWLLKCAVTEAEKTRTPEVKELVGLLREREEEIASLRGGVGASTEGVVPPFVRTSARPSSQSSSSKYFRSRGESYSTNASGRSRARDSQQLDDDRDIASRVETSMRRLASLRSLLEHTRTANSTMDEGMNEFIASVVHQIHDDERDYRMLMALQFDTPAAEDLLIEQIEISKLKMLFDFRNLFQEHTASVDSKSGRTSYDQRSMDTRDWNTVADTNADTGQLDRCLAILEEVSSNMTNVTDDGSVNTPVKSARSRDSTITTATRQSAVNKTDVSLDNASFLPEGASWSRNVSAVSAVSGKKITSPRGTSHVSVAISENVNPVENLGSSPEEVSSARRGSVVSTATRRTQRVSIGPQPSVPGAEEAPLRINGSSISTSTRRTSVGGPSDNQEDPSSSPRSDGRSLQTEYTASSVRRRSLAPQNLSTSKMQEVASTLAQAGSFRDASSTSVANRVYPIDQTLSLSNTAVKSIIPSEAALDNTYSVYPNQISPTQTCSETTRRSFLPQMGASSFVPNPNPLACALVMDNLLDLVPKATGPAEISSASRRTLESQSGPRRVSIMSYPSPTDNPVDHTDDVHSLHNVSAVSTATRRSAGPQAGTSTISTMSRAPPNRSSVDITNSPTGARPLANASAVSTATRRSIVQEPGTSAVSMKSKAPHSNISVVVDNTQSDALPLANASAVSPTTRRSIIQEPGTSAVSMKSKAPHSNISVVIDNTQADGGPLANASAVSTATRRSIAQEAGTSAVSMKLKAPHSNISVAIDSNQADEGPLANASAVSTATRRSIAQEAGTSAVSMKSKAPHSNISVVVDSNQAYAGPLANASAVSTATTRSGAPPTETSARRSSAVSAATMRSPEPPITGTSHVSAAEETPEDNDVQPTSSLILDYLAPREEISSLPNSSFNILSTHPTDSFVVQSTDEPPDSSHQIKPSKSSVAFDIYPNLNEASKIATGECDDVESPNVTSDMLTETNEDNTFAEPEFIPLDFPGGAVSSVQSTVNSPSRKQVSAPSPTGANPRESTISTGQNSVQANIASAPRGGSAVSAVSGRQAEIKSAASMNAEVSPRNTGVSPTEARRSSTTRNSAPQAVGLDDGKEQPPVAALQSAIKHSTVSAAAPKSVTHQIRDVSPSVVNETNDPSLRTIYKGGVKNIPGSANTFKPREDMHQCDEESKCLTLAATQAEFDAYYGTDRTESYTCTISIPSTTPVTKEALGCYEVIPCSSIEFGGSSVDATGNTPSMCPEASFKGGCQQNDCVTPATRVLPTNCAESNPLLTIEDLCLTGDPEIDEEIIAFYKARNCIG